MASEPLLDSPPPAKRMRRAASPGASSDASSEPPDADVRGPGAAAAAWRTEAGRREAARAINARAPMQAPTHSLEAAEELMWELDDGRGFAQVPLLSAAEVEALMRLLGRDVLEACPSAAAQGAVDADTGRLHEDKLTEQMLHGVASTSVRAHGGMPVGRLARAARDPAGVGGRVRAAFAAALGLPAEDLVCSVDAPALATARQTASEQRRRLRLWLHIDQVHTRGRSVQGALLLRDAGCAGREGALCFAAAPGMQRVVRRHLDELRAAAGRDDWLRVDKMAREGLGKLAAQFVDAAVPVGARAGHLLLWNSQTPHANRPGAVAPRGDGQLRRAQMMLTWRPRADFGPRGQARMTSLLLSGHPGTHFAEQTTVNGHGGEPRWPMRGARARLLRRIKPALREEALQDPEVRDALEASGVHVDADWRARGGAMRFAAAPVLRRLLPDAVRRAHGLEADA